MIENIKSVSFELWSASNNSLMKYHSGMVKPFRSFKITFNWSLTHITMLQYEKKKCWLIQVGIYFLIFYFMRIYKGIEQQSSEWFDLRKCKLTASHAQEIGNNGKWLETYILEMMAESFSSAPKEIFSNEHTARGNELEPQAREIYELVNMVTVEEVSFIEMNEFIWCSPDGLVWEEWGLEIKCQNDVKHFKMILDWVEKHADSGYIWQCQYSLWITWRKWWDLAFYNPNFEQSLLVLRIFPDAEKHKKLEEGCLTGISKIKEIRSKFQK